MLRLEVITYLDRLMTASAEQRAAGWPIVKLTLEANRDPDGEEWENMNAVFDEPVVQSELENPVENKITKGTQS